jgi:hypothetical protein
LKYVSIYFPIYVRDSHGFKRFPKIDVLNFADFKTPKSEDTYNEIINKYKDGLKDYLHYK